MKPIASLSLMALSVSAQANAPQFEDLASLEARASAVAGAPVQALDRRIRLAQCPQDAVVELAEPGSVAVRCLALGWRIRITVSKSATAYSTLIQRLVIKRGDGVEVTVAGDGFELKSQAVALDDAAEGQSLRVKSLATATMNQGIAVGPGKVMLTP